MSPRKTRKTARLSSDDAYYQMNLLRLISVILAGVFAALAPAGMPAARSAELKLTAAEAMPVDAEKLEWPDQLPHSRVARGTGNIAAAWLAGPTDRYPHGVLGDDREASRLVVATAGGRQLEVKLPSHRVFEDLEPRLADMDADGRDEILVVESDISMGASLAVYAVIDRRLVAVAATPFLGLANRWLNPLGVGDFDGDGRMDVALVATPHIGGKLRLYKYQPGQLVRFAEYSGVSTHRIGSTQLGLGRVVPAAPRDRLLVPDQSHQALILLEWTPAGWIKHARVSLPATLASSLSPVGRHVWRFDLHNGDSYTIAVVP